MDDLVVYTPPTFLSDPGYVALFDNLYDSLLHRQGFEQFLHGMSRHFRSCSVALLAIHDETRTLEWAWLSRESPGFRQWCDANGQGFAQAILRGMEETGVTPERFSCAGLVLDGPALVDAVAGNLRPWLQREGIVDTASLAIPIPGRGRVLLALQRDQAIGAFTANDLQALNMLVPHIRRVAGLLFHIYYRAPARPAPSANEIRQRFPLTESEAAVCELLVKMLTPKEIARERDVSIHTVREQMRKIYLKTGCRSKVDVIAAILQAFPG